MKNPFSPNVNFLGSNSFEESLQVPANSFEPNFSGHNFLLLSTIILEESSSVLSPENSILSQATKTSCTAFSKLKNISNTQISCDKNYKIKCKF